MVTLPNTGAVTALLYRRTEAGTSSDEMAQGVNRLRLCFPAVKQAGTDNPSAGVIAVFWSDVDEAPSLANGIQLFQMYRGDDTEIRLADFVNSGYFWARVHGGAAAELHVCELR